MESGIAYLDRKSFKILLYPRGNIATAQNYVSFYVINLSDVVTRIDVEFTVGTLKCTKQQGQVVQPRNMTGLTYNYISHNK